MKHTYHWVTRGPASLIPLSMARIPPVLAPVGRPSCFIVCCIWHLPHPLRATRPADKRGQWINEMDGSSF